MTRRHRALPRPLPLAVAHIVDSLVARLGDDLQAPLWHGPFARGEERPDSDVLSRRLVAGLDE